MNMLCSNSFFEVDKKIVVEKRKSGNSVKLQNPESRSKKSVLPHWDGAIYSKYAARSYDFTTYMTGWRKKLARYALEDVKPCKALDVGCGTGYLMNLAVQKGFIIKGLDPSEGMLSKARGKYGFDLDGLVLGPADTMPFKDGEFDLVIASGSLVHVPNIEDAAKEIMRVLKVGGLLRIIDHAEPKDTTIFTPLIYMFSQASGDILHDYEFYFSKGCKLVHHKTIGRAGFMQRFDFLKTSASILP